MGVGYCLFDTGFPEPLPDERKMLHTFFLLTTSEEQGTRMITDE